MSLFLFCLCVSGFLVQILRLPINLYRGSRFAAFNVVAMIGLRYGALLNLSAVIAMFA